MSNDFYVYLYFRLDGSPLYVGKGRGKRWREHKNRNCNKHLRNIIEQAKALSRELPVVFIHENLSEAVALEYEIALIAAIGRETAGGPLCNQTDGGEGMSGWKQSDETRAKRSRSLKGVPKSKEHAANAAAARKATGWKPTPEHVEKLKRINSTPATLERIAKIKNTVNLPENRERTLDRAAHARRALAEKRAAGLCDDSAAVKKTWITRREKGHGQPKWTDERREKTKAAMRAAWVVRRARLKDEEHYGQQQFQWV